MTLEEFARQLDGIGQSIEETPSTLAQIGERLVNQMKLRVPVDTGALRNSISYQINGDDLSFSMLAYGQFQNYGVMGLLGPLANPVPFGVEPQPSRPPFYSFESREFGLVPQPFYDVDDLLDQIMTALQNSVDNI
jgi:hypothetical protein